MLDSWYLAKNVFVYQEDVSTNIISYVYNLSIAEKPRFKNFKLPDSIKICKPKANDMEALVQQHAYKDKDSLRTYIRDQVGHEFVDSSLMTMYGDRLVIIASDEVVHLNLT